MRPCSVERLDAALLMQVDTDILDRKPYADIMRKYDLKSKGVSRQSLRRHAINHTARTAVEQKNKIFMEENIQKKIRSTVDYLNELITSWFKDPDNLKMLGPKDILSALKMRSSLMNESRGPERVEIVWGAGLKTLKGETIQKATFRIELPTVQTQKSENEKNKDKSEENEME